MKTTCILKSRHFIVIAMCFFAFTANAQASMLLSMPLLT